MTSRNYSSAWTDERVAIAMKMWQDGESASFIADTLGAGLSRNAVIGKIHRMGLFSRDKGRKQGQRYYPDNQSQPRPRAPQGESARTESPRVERQRLPSGALNPYLIPDAESDLAIPVEQRKTIQQLTSRTCKWPVGDPGSVDFFFCGAEKEIDTPYCRSHCRRAYIGFSAPRPAQHQNYNPGGRGP